MGKKRRSPPEFARLLTPTEVAAMFHVSLTTVLRWANDGKLTYVHTLGGRRRYLESEIRALLGETSDPPAGS